MPFQPGHKLAPGGKRPNSGRKGNPYRKILKQRIAERGYIEPREFMLDILNDSSQDDKLRMEAARGVAPYIHNTVASEERMRFESGLLDMRLKRIDDGKPTEIVQLVLPPIRTMAIPEALERASRGLSLANKEN